MWNDYMNKDYMNDKYEVNKDFKTILNFNSVKDFYDYLKVGDEVEIMDHRGEFDFINGKNFKIAGKFIKRDFNTDFYSVRLDKNFLHNGLASNNLHCSWIKISLRKQKFKRILK